MSQKRRSRRFSFSQSGGWSGGKKSRFDLETLENRELLSLAPLGTINSAPQYPANVTPAGGDVFYTVIDPTGQGLALYVTTPANHGNPTLLHDFTFQPTSNVLSFNTYLTNFAAAGSKVFFDVNGSQIWTSDGTSAGTLELADYGASNFPAALTASGNDIFYVVGPHLYRSDGTASGTAAVSAFASGGTYQNLLITNFTPDNGQLLVSGANGTTSVELLLTDGLGHTSVLANLPVPSGSSPGTIGDISVAGSNVYFALNSADGNTESLYAVEGGTAPATLLQTFQRPTGAAGQVVSEPVVVGSSLYFVLLQSATGVSLMNVNGSTFAVATMHSFTYPSSVSGELPFDLLNNLTPVGSNLVFSADDAAGGPAVWKSDGQSIGTTSMVSLSSSLVGGYSGLIGDRTLAGGKLFFTAVNPAESTGLDLWSTDGSTGTLVGAINPPSYTGLPLSSYFAALNGSLLFANNDGVSGVELWTSNGTAGNLS